MSQADRNAYVTRQRVILRDSIRAVSVRTDSLWIRKTPDLMEFVLLLDLESRLSVLVTHQPDSGLILETEYLNLFTNALFKEVELRPIILVWVSLQVKNI